MTLLEERVSVSSFSFSWARRAAPFGVFGPLWGENEVIAAAKAGENVGMVPRVDEGDS